MYRQHRLREIGLRRGVSRDKNGLRRGLAGLNRTWTFDPCTPCLKFCTPTYKILPNSLLVQHYAGWSACTPTHSVRNILIAQVLVILKLFYFKYVFIFCVFLSCHNLDVQIGDMYKFKVV